MTAPETEATDPIDGAALARGNVSMRTLAHRTCAA